MRTIIILILFLTACAKGMGSPEVKSADGTPALPDPISSVLPNPPSSPQPSPTPAPTIDATYLPSQVYTPVPGQTRPNYCPDPGFQDFTILHDNVGIFFTSTPENIVIDHTAKTITFIANVTGHQGLVLAYQYIGSNEWQITYQTNCSSLYKLP